MAAALRLPKHMPAEEKEAAVADLIQRLGLVQSADTPVGTFPQMRSPTTAMVVFNGGKQFRYLAIYDWEAEAKIRNGNR